MAVLDWAVTLQVLYVLDLYHPANRAFFVFFLIKKERKVGTT